MDDRHRSTIDRIFAETIALHEQTRRGDLTPLLRAVETIRAGFAEGQALLVFGNGGSAADAQHFAAEFVGRFQRERRAVPALALTTDTSALTAIANDYAFDRVFARQVEAFGARGMSPSPLRRAATRPTSSRD